MPFSADVIVIGAGLAGLTAAWQIAAAGQRVRLISKGWGATHWHAGCIDVLGYLPDQPQLVCESPRAGLDQLAAVKPDHPLARLGAEKVAEALAALQALCLAADYPLHGSLERSWLLPSAVGAVRPTCLAPETMTAGDLRLDAPMLIAGFHGLGDFFPNLIADNLRAQGHPAQGAMLRLEQVVGRRSMNPVLLASLFETAEFREEVAAALQPHLGEAQRIGFPAVLGLQQPLAVKADLEAKLGRPVFEIPSLPPSVAGMRLHRILVKAIREHGGRVFDGMEAVKADIEGDQVTAVYTEAAARLHPQRAKTYLLATGGILGGGITTDHDGSVRETIFNLPLPAIPDHTAWFSQEFLDPAGHPIYNASVQVDAHFQPADHSGNRLYRNLFAAGTTLAHCEPLRERSFEGVALSTGYWVGRQAAKYESS